MRPVTGELFPELNSGGSSNQYHQPPKHYHHNAGSTHHSHHQYRPSPRYLQNQYQHYSQEGFMNNYKRI